LQLSFLPRMSRLKSIDFILENKVDTICLTQSTRSIRHRTWALQHEVTAP
jgi:hypothetical protein